MIKLRRKSLQAKWFEGEGIVDQIVQQGKIWRVKFQATYWNARATTAVILLPGDFVRIVDVDNITLLIEPIAS